MQKKESINLDQKLIDKIIKVAYGDAGIVDRIYVNFKSSSDQKILGLLKEYKHTVNAVHTLKQKNAPDHIIETVKNYVMGKDQRESLSSRFSRAFFILFGKRAIPVTALGIVLILIVSFFVFREPAPSHKYSKAEIMLAEKQFRQSIAIIGDVFQKAEKNFSHEVLDKQINKNLNRGYSLVNNILTGG
jgi:hypothetical protein